MLLGCPAAPPPPPASGEENEDALESGGTRAEGKGAAESQERWNGGISSGAAESPPPVSGGENKEGNKESEERGAAAGTMHFNTDALHGLLSKRRFRVSRFRVSGFVSLTNCQWDLHTVLATEKDR